MINCCRICGTGLSKPVLNLGKQALTGLFIKNGHAVEKHQVSLSICLNKKCQLVQINEVYDLNLLYGDHYGYESSLNSSMSSHLKNKIDSINKDIVLNDGDTVVDIGSNDATSLSFYPNNLNKIGVDPTGIKFVDQYQELGIHLVDELFPSSKLDLKIKNRKVKVFTSFACFYDLPDPVKFAKSISDYLAQDGLWYLEQSYLPLMLSTNSFDTLCHEHIEYYRLANIDFIANQAGLEIKDVEFNDINGGSFGVKVGHKNDIHPVSSKVSEVLEKELAMDLFNEFEKFNERVQESKEETIKLLKEIKKDGGRVIGLGASTKGNVLLQYYGIDSDLIESIGEVNPNKFGCQTPGTGIPIISEEEALNLNADYYMILPWHFKNFFLEKEKFSGRNLIFPLPNLTVITP